MPPTPDVDRVGFWQYDCSFYTGELPVDEAIAAAGYEPNGHFWECLLRYLQPKLASAIEFDSEGGMFAVFGRRSQMKRVQRALAPYLLDGRLVVETVEAAEQAGFSFELDFDD